MNDQKFDINSLQIASPCSVGWETMTGDERTRHCSLCSLNVHNISELTAVEVRRLVGKSEGRLCIRMYRRFDGTVLTKDCPVGLRAVRRRVARFAGATLTAVLGLFSISFGQNEEITSVDAAISKSATVSDLVSENNLTGVVQDLQGAVIPNAAILLYKKDEMIPASKTTSDDSGNYRFSNISPGVYRIEVPAHMGFLKLVVMNVEILRGKSTDVKLQMSVPDDLGWVGLMAVPSLAKPPLIDMTTPGPSQTVITREMLDKIPGRRPY